MKTLIPSSLLLVTVLSGCSLKQPPCEQILEVKQQERQCQQWRKIMQDNRYPQQALTAKKQYEQACLELRHYRDQFDTICKGDERPITPRIKD